MATSTYAQLAGDPNLNVIYTETEPIGSTGYPNEENYAILGPVYTPRIHGVGLSALEIASSDMVAFTLKESHALNMGLYDDRNMSFMRTTSSNHSFEVATHDSQVSLTLNGEDKNMKLYAASNIDIQTGGALSFVVPDSDLFLRAGQAGSTKDRSELSLRESGVFDIYASDNLNLSSSSNLDIFVDNRFTARALNYEFSTSNYYAFSVDGSSEEIMRLERDKMTLHGNLDIHGTINSISQTVTQLDVQDKTIKLAVAGNDSTNIVDGPDNNEAGIIVAGFPDTVDPGNSATQKEYEKSIRWNYGNGGIDRMLTSVDNGALDESYWDVRGGSIRMTSYKSNTDEELGYGMRINDKDQLEMVRYFDDGGVKKASSFIRFGRK